MNDRPPLTRYDPERTYRWNYEHAPEPPAGVVAEPVPGRWTYCGVPVPSPLGIAAGPLLNGRWVLYYAALGFDVLTYKTTRSGQRACYPLPNLQPVAVERLEQAGGELATSAAMNGSWAVSFGMPSMAPDVWRADVERTRSHLPKEKLLAVSVVATPEPDWSIGELAADFARCARWAVESGADCVEVNFSCPNVATSDGQLYQQPAAAEEVAATVRAAIGAAPLIIKVGFVPDEAGAAALLGAVAPHAQALAMTNCISARVRGADDRRLFDGQPRGIGGECIRDASIAQVARFARVARERGYATRMIGVGGIFSGDHVRQYLAAGAEAVQLATAPMVDPKVGLAIRRQLAAGGGKPLG